MTTIFKFSRLAAGVSLAALSAASVASAQPLANPLLPSGARPPAAEGTGNFLRPRVGVQVAFTDNVESANANKKSDTIGRATVGVSGRYDSPRAKLNVNGDVLYDVYAKNHKYDSLSANGAVSASYIVAPEVLALEGAAAQTQGSVTTFGSTDFYRSANGNDYQVGTYYVGPHLTLQPGIFDVSAAARYGQTFYGTRNSPNVLIGDQTTSFYQVIGAADTKDRLGKIRFVTSGQYQADDEDFESTSGSVSSFFAVTDRLTGIARLGYDDANLTATQDIKSTFWSVGGQYINQAGYIRLEGGQRYDDPYFSGDMLFRVSRTVRLAADYSVSLSPGAIAINNVLVDYVGGLDQALPLPGSSGSFSLDTTYFSAPSLNRTGRVSLGVDLGRQALGLAVAYVEQKFRTNIQDFHTFSQELAYTNQLRPDLQASLTFGHANGTGNRFVGASTEGHYYQVAAAANYGLNSRTNLTVRAANRRFRASGGVTGRDFDENIASIALLRQF